MVAKNHWYMAAWSDELQADKPLARTILGLNLVLYRDAAGRLAAVDDWCPHRGLPLSLGRILPNGNLQCLYHGIQYDGTGACVKIPGQDTIPGDFKLNPYPIAEKNRQIWIWVGDPQLASANSMPDFWWLGHPDWLAVKGHFLVRAQYRLMLENLHDMNHLEFVHAKTVGTGDGSAAMTQAVEGDDTTLTVQRWLMDKPAPPLFAKAGNFKGNVDRWAHSLYRVPSNVVLDVGCATAGSGTSEERRAHGITQQAIHCLTPAGDGQTNYFWAYVRNYKLDDANVTEIIRKGIEQTFQEDVEVLEAQQRNLSSRTSQKLMSIKPDAVVLRVRRMLDKFDPVPADKSRTA